MREAITFFVEMILISGTFFLGYRLVFNHATASFRRLYLLAWLIFSIAFPLISIEIPVTSPVSSVSVQDFIADPTPPISFEPSGALATSEADMTPTPTEIASPRQENSFDWGFAASVAYLLVVLALVLRIALGYFQVWKLKKKATIQQYEGREILEVADPAFKGASFFQWVFIGKSIKENRELVLSHELAHSDLHHSIDILFSHMYCAFFWANPFAWVLKGSIAINTELETDARITEVQDSKTYANLLIDLSKNSSGSPLMNHFSAKHLKMRITAMKNGATYKKWVYYFTTVVSFGLFFLISCTGTDLSNEISAEARLYDVKTITSYFISHQTDTQQKTGKMVSRATFLPNGELDQLVNKTSYPYDREYESKQEFWQQPIKKNLPYVMDGLSMGVAERNLLYGNDWPAAYAQFLLNVEVSEEGRMPWKEVYEIDNLDRPTEIKKVNVADTTDEKYVSFLGPDITTFYDYEEGKVSSISIARNYPDIERRKELHKHLDQNVMKSQGWKEMQKEMEKSGKKLPKNSYTYEGDLLTSIVVHSYDKTQRQHRFYYNNELLTKSEYYIAGALINTRMHYYEDGLKQRTEIFNVDNEPEYTINYEYEFWE